MCKVKIRLHAKLIAIGCNNYLCLNSILQNGHQHNSPHSQVQLEVTFKCSFRELTPIRVYTVPQSRTERRKILKFHIQSRFLYIKIICTRETRVICMNIRCMYKKFTNIFRCRMSRNITHYGGDRFKVEHINR